MALDPNAVIAEGPFAGLTVQQALDHAAALQASSERGSEPPPKPPVTAPQKTPQQILDENAANRVDQATLLTWNRLEQDDERAFSATVPDYATFKPKIDELKKGLHPAVRMGAGLHKRLYENLKLEDPAVQASIYGTQAPPPPAADPPPADPPADPPAGDPPQAPPKPPSPSARPAPPGSGPIAPPTPTSRVAQPPAPPARQPKLKPNAKLEAAARVWGMPLNDYLIQLEDRGMTQEDVDTVSAPRASNNTYGSTAYGRTRTGR